jgi:hypothetical protein
MSTAGRSAADELRGDPLKNALPADEIMRRIDSISSGLTLGAIG